MKTKRRIFLVGLPLAVILAGALAMKGLEVLRPAPRKAAPPPAGALVRVIEVHRVDRTARVLGTGTVQPLREVTLVPQVGGKVVEVAPGFVAGGFFRAGDLLFRIEDADYRLAVRKARAALARAKVELAQVEGKARVAREEWERIEGKGAPPPSPLVLYGPQLEEARAAVAAAEADLAKAELDLARTRVSAPFDCRVRSEQVEVGQVVNPGAQVAVLAGTAAAEIVVPLPVAELAWIRFPPAGSDEGGSPARVRYRAAGVDLSWRGRVVRALGEVDPKGRMARVVVRVDHPYGGRAGDPGPAGDLAEGLFVAVEIEGRSLRGVVAVPRSVLHEGETVWIMDGARRLRVRRLQVARYEGDEVLAAGGLDDGDRVVVTPLVGAADGMRLRLAAGGGGR
ncbi:efflux RND transporter periplasmic adaptor subunit [Dissulfurirhabdus thermomarina]|uniref:Efflux RND transporter periplasmic adaptor subunit n=1 Tax=Dissulfurirhabdus thermomarina TaxID=1765737 RepID=A0A6N9TPQ2_DISTH|nr:efflux RND transporter periplasmic adaptor subunit [Dissulfurirhabdus thermomarina]NDY43028.1 efflux RND transporter periplasmic adaptor subunit [Dissulfurirhabdus thermomarina]NMX22913.1 efflux RND transporter periplasmic adaptor subunit [Dissulfurirhabdus thermomarina]